MKKRKRTLPALHFVVVTGELDFVAKKAVPISEENFHLIFSEEFSNSTRKDIMMSVLGLSSYKDLRYLHASDVLHLDQYFASRNFFHGFAREHGGLVFHDKAPRLFACIIELKEKFIVAPVNPDDLVNIQKIPSKDIPLGNITDKSYIQKLLTANKRARYHKPIERIRSDVYGNW